MNGTDAYVPCLSRRRGAIGRRLLRARPSSGFTLVELMVALTLAAMISVSIMFISSQAREAYQGTVKKVDVIGRFRYVFGQIEEDFKNWIPTGDQEFYTDGRGGRGALVNGHWDPGEELPDRRDQRGPGVVDGGVFGEYDEFATITALQYYSKEPQTFEEKLHDAYQVYFRTRMYIDGSVRDVNVEYMLLDPSADPSRPIPVPPTRVAPKNVADLALFKIVRYFDVNPELIKKPTDNPIVRKVVEVCSNVTDFRVEYMTAGSRAEGPKFKTPEDEFRSPSEIVTQPVRVGGLGATDAYRKSFGYGSMKLEVQYPRAVVIPAIRGDDGLTGAATTPQPVRFGFEGNPTIRFAELVPGDEIFVFTQSDRAGAALGAGGSAQNVTAVLRFPTKDYSIKSNINGLIEFEQDLDTSEWNNQRKSNIYYKAGYIPPAVRITLRVVDDDGLNPRTMQREVWMLRRSE